MGRDRNARPPHLLTVLFMVLLLALGVALAQGFANDPFFDDTEALMRAHGVEMLSARLLALEALATEPADEDDGDESEEGEEGESDTEEVAEALEVDLRRFAATLAATDPDLAERLEEAVEAVEGAAEGDDPDALAASARAAADLADEARTALAGDRLDDPAFAAALMTLLLTTENGGIGEAYEEAVEGEVGAYATGWTALARVEAMWATLGPLATDTQRFEIDDMLGELNALFPGPRPGEAVARSDPEEAEGATQRIGGFLEELADADLFPSRDLGRLLGHVRDLAAAGCDAYTEGDGPLGGERIAAAGYLYGEYLANTLAMFSPGPAGEAAELFDALAPGSLGEEEGEEGDEGEEGAEDDEDEDEAEPFEPSEAAERCGELLERLGEVGGPLGI